MDHQHPNNQHPNINQTQNQQQLYGNPIANLSHNNINNVDGTHLPNGGYQPNFYNEQYPIPHPPNSFNLNNTPYQYQQYQQYQQFLQFKQFEQYRNHPYYQSPHQTPFTHPQFTQPQFTQPQFRPFQPVPQQFAQLFQQQQQPPQSAVNNSRVGSINNSGNGNENNINDTNNNNSNNSTTKNSNNSTTTNNNTTNTSNTDSNSSSDSKSCCVWTGIFDNCSKIPDDINIWNVKNGTKTDRKLNKMIKKAKEEVHKQDRDKQAQLCIFNIINIKMMKPTSILQEWTTDAMLVLFCKGAAQCLGIKRLSYKHVINCVKYNWYNYLMHLAIKYNKDEQFKVSLTPTYYDNYKNIIPMLKAFISYTNVKVQKGCLKRSNLNNELNNINTDNNMNITNAKTNETNSSIRYGPVRGTSNNVLRDTANERMSTLRSSALGCIDNDNDADDENDDDEDDEDDEDQLIQDVMNTIDFKKICGWQEDGVDN